MAQKERLVVQDLANRLPGLSPAASPSGSQFVQAGRTHVGAPDADSNNLMKVAGALRQLEPTVNQAIGQYVHKVSDEEFAEGQKAFFENRKPWNEAVKAGTIPVGASPYFVRGYQRAHLRDLAAGYGDYIRLKYQEDPIHESDDIKAFNGFLSNSMQEYRTQVLAAGDGSSAFSALDIKEAFDPLMVESNESLRRHHVSYRLEEHKKFGEEALMQGVQRIITDTPDDLHDDPEFGKVFDARVNRLLYDEREGLVKNGLPGSRANQLVVDSIVNLAERKAQDGNATGAFQVLSMMDHVTTNGGRASLGNSKYAKEKRLEAEQKIVANQMQQERFNRTREDWAIEGDFETRKARFEAAEQHRQKEWERADARWASEMESASRLDRERNAKAQVDADKALIMTGAKLGDLANQRIYDAFERMKVLDPDAAMAMENYINHTTKQRGSFVETPATRLTLAAIRRDMSEHPETFDSSVIFNSVNNDLISGDHAMKLYDDWERLRTNMDHPYMRHPMFQEYLDKVAKGVGASPTDEYGEGAIKSAKAKMLMREMAQDWLAENPKGTATQFLDFIGKTVEPAVLKMNTDLLDSRTSAKEQEIEKAKPKTKVEEPGFFGKMLGKQPKVTTTPGEEPKPKPGDTKLTPKDLSVLMPREAQREIVEISKRILSTGTDGQKPTTEKELHDALVRHLSPIYQAWGRPPSEMVEAIDQMSKVLLRKSKAPSQPKKE